MERPQYDAPVQVTIVGRSAKALASQKRRSSMPGKRVQFDDETWHALDLLARDRMMEFQELADEAFGDLLKKHGRPADLKSALRESVKKEDLKRPLPKKGPSRL